MGGRDAQEADMTEFGDGEAEGLKKDRSQGQLTSLWIL